MIFMCEEEAATTKESTAQVKLKITDAPLDDQHVTAAVVTVSEIYLNETKLQSFAGAGIDLLQYQNGEVFTLGDFELSMGSYSTLKSGCYVKDDQGIKHGLITSNASIEITLAEDIVKAEENSFVIDFDSRNAIMATPDGTDDYDLLLMRNL